MAITQPFLPEGLAVGLFAAIVAVLGVVVWRTASDLQGHVRAAAEAIVDALGRQSREATASSGVHALQRAYRVLPGLGEPFPVKLGATDPAVGRRLSELGLRGRTGATIIAISRHDEVVLVPDGHAVLEAGDVLALAGTRDAIEAARRLLVGDREG